VRNLLLIIAELGLLAAAQLLGGPPWTVLAAVALVLESAAGLSAAGLARLALAFVWLGIFRLTDNRELFFCYSMTLAIHLALRFAVRRWLLRAAAGGLVITVFLGFRIAQQATLKVLAVETAVSWPRASSRNDSLPRVSAGHRRRPVRLLMPRHHRLPR
jgi:hypothetical protein